MTVDHIIPKSQGGSTEFANLCFCCRACNEFKGQKITAEDSSSGEVVSLYHPRQHLWQEHFTWNEPGTSLVGLTTVGRVTIIGLKMNNQAIVSARRRWVSAGWHPLK